MRLRRKVKGENSPEIEGVEFEGNVISAEDLLNGGFENAYDDPFFIDDGESTETPDRPDRDQSAGGGSELPVAVQAEAAKAAVKNKATNHKTLDGSGSKLSPEMLQLKHRAHEELIGRLSTRLFDTSASETDLEPSVIEEFDSFLADENISLSALERADLAEELVNDVLKHGPIEPLLQDPEVTEVMVNGPYNIFVERGGHLFKTDAQFSNELALRQVITRIASKVGRRVDESSPMVDARLPDGSRVNAIVPPLAVDGSSLTIRKFSADPLTVHHLISFGSISVEAAGLLDACVRGRLNILVSGGTGSGKTTLLNVLSSFIPNGERIVTIEDSVELQLKQDHIVRLETRPENTEGRGAVDIRDLVKNSLRMRPDRIVVGECRSGEALDMLQAMNTGHDGSLSTLHANTPRDAISRLETMVLMAGMDLPSKAIREQISSAVDVIVQLSRLSDGSRRVMSITEIVGMEGDVVTLNEIFAFDFDAGINEHGKFLGSVKPTGIRPKFTEKLSDYGVEVDASLFSTGPVDLMNNS
jgi:pilus assembly protein CpaF